MESKIINTSQLLKARNLIYIEPISSSAEDRFYFEPFLSLSSEYLVHFTRLMEAYQAEEEEK